MVAGHPWTATSIDEVASSEASPQKPNSNVVHPQPVTMSPSKVSVVRQRRSPAEVRAVASTKILRIQAVIASLGPDDAEERATLETALARSRQLAAVPPVDKRIADTEAFIARAQKRVAAEAAKIFEAEKQKQLFEEELAQAEKDSEGFRREAETFQVSGGRLIPVDPTSSLEAEFARVRAELAQLKGAGTDPDAPCVPVVKRTCRMGDGRAVIPAELSAWLEERHADLHDALVTGDNNRILELTTKLSEGAERMIEMVGGMVS